MTEAKYEEAAGIVKRAIALKASIESLGHVPDKIIMTTIEGELDEVKTHEVLIYVEDAGNPNDIICRIHQLLFDDLVRLRDQLKIEFEEL